VAPAVALAGALATAPHFYHLATAPTSLASDIGGASRADASPGISSGIGRATTLHAHGATYTPARPSKKTGPVGSSGGKATASTRPSTPAAPATSNSPSDPASSPTASPTPTPSPSTSAPATLTCSGSGGLLPANYQAIVGFLMAHGYTGLGAAGIAGNIYQESKGNPESIGSGGGGLIGWTPLPSGFVTGNPAADLQTQLEALLTYNQQWAQYVPALNAAASATQAAYIYMIDFERPGIPAAANREGAAAAIAAACHL
jgi:hypothetical protein